MAEIKSEITNATRWLAVFRPNTQARLRLFCFPYAGGGAMIFRKWPDMLPADVELCALRLPGRESRLGDSPYSNVFKLIDDLVPPLIPLLDKPFAFFGHSMGALISFELAQKLREQYDVSPVHLFVSGRSAPQVPDAEPRSYDLPESEFIEELRRLNGTPQDVLEHREIMQLMIPLLRADFAITQDYVYSPRPPLNCPLSVFGGIYDKEVSRENLIAWGALTTGSFSLKMYEGDHFFINTMPENLLRDLSLQLNTCLSESRDGQ